MTSNTVNPTRMEFALRKALIALEEVRHPTVHGEHDPHCPVCYVRKVVYEGLVREGASDDQR